MVRTFVRIQYFNSMRFKLSAPIEFIHLLSASNRLSIIYISKIVGIFYTANSSSHFLYVACQGRSKLFLLHRNAHVTLQVLYRLILHHSKSPAVTVSPKPSGEKPSGSQPSVETNVNFPISKKNNGLQEAICPDWMPYQRRDLSESILGIKSCRSSYYNCQKDDRIFDGIQPGRIRDYG